MRGGGQTFFGTSSLHKSDPGQVASWNHVAMLTESLNISISISRPGLTHSIDWFCEDLSHNYFEDELKIQWKTLILIDFGILADRFSSVSGGCLGFRVGPLWFVQRSYRYVMFCIWKFATVNINLARLLEIVLHIQKSWHSTKGFLYKPSHLGRCDRFVVKLIFSTRNHIVVMYFDKIYNN